MAKRKRTKAESIELLKIRQRDILAALQLGREMKERAIGPYANRAIHAETRLREAAQANAHSPETIAEAIGLYDSIRASQPERKISAVQKDVQQKTGLPPRTLRYHLKKRREASEK